MWGQFAGMRLPTEVKRYFEGDLWSTYHWPDTTALANGSYDLFTVRIGQNGQGFTGAGGTGVVSIAETNMREAGRIASGLAYTVRQVAFDPFYDDESQICATDLKNLQVHCVPVWSFLNTEVEIAPTILVGQGGGIFGSTADTGANEGGNGGSRIVLNNGAGQTWIYHELPVLLPANTTFSVALKFGANAAVVDGGIQNADLRARVHLIGVATSAVPQG